MGRVTSVTVIGWSGAASIPLPVRSVTAPASMSSWGEVILWTVWRWMSESVRVIVIESASRALVVISSSERPPEDSPVSRMAIRS